MIDPKPKFLTSEEMPNVEVFFFFHLEEAIFQKSVPARTLPSTDWLNDPAEQVI